MGKEFEIEKLRGSKNYHTWAFAIKNVLILKGVEKCINRVAVAATATTVATTIYVKKLIPKNVERQRPL